MTVQEQHQARMREAALLTQVAKDRVYLHRREVRVEWDGSPCCPSIGSFLLCYRGAKWKIYAPSKGLKVFSELQ